MADTFVPVDVPATSRARVAFIGLASPRNQVPGVTVVPERVITVGEEEIAQGMPAIGIAFDPSRIIYLMDPTTDQFTGQTTTWGAMFVGIKSMALNEYLRSIGDPSMVDKPATPTQQAEQQAAQEGLQQQLGEAPQG